MHTWVIAAALIVLIMLARWAADNRFLTECEPRPSVVCPNVSEERLVVDDDDLHRYVAVIQVKPVAAQVTTVTALTFVPDDSPWFIPRRSPVAFVNPAVLAAETMRRGSELAAGFRFVAPGVVEGGTIVWRKGGG